MVIRIINEQFRAWLETLEMLRVWLKQMADVSPNATVKFSSIFYGQKKNNAFLFNQFDFRTDFKGHYSLS